MQDDLDLTGDRYDWLLTIFYISYIIFEFQGIMWKILPPHQWAAFVVFGWGLAEISIMMTTVAICTCPDLLALC